MAAYTEGETGLTIDRKLREEKKKHRSAPALVIDHGLKRYNRHRYFLGDRVRGDPVVFTQSDYTKRLREALTQDWVDKGRSLVRHLSHLGSHLPSLRAPTLAMDREINDYFDNDTHIAVIMKENDVRCEISDSE